MDIAPMKTQRDYRRALKRIEDLNVSRPIRPESSARETPPIWRQRGRCMAAQAIEGQTEHRLSTQTDLYPSGEINRSGRPPRGGLASGDGEQYLSG
jgi:hypothetical protein